VFGQGLSLDIAHNHVRPAVILPDIVKGTDVRVTDSGGGTSLTLEAPNAHGLGVCWPVEARQLK
jgi:hypothetical protein